MCSPTFTPSTSTRSVSVISPSARGMSSVRSTDGRSSGTSRRLASCRRSTRSPASCANTCPCNRASSIAHGDYRFGNCLTDVARRSHRRRPRLGAVHPRRSACRPRLSRRVLVRRVHADRARQRSRLRPAGSRTYADLVDRYATRTGRDVSDIAYYIAFGCWRLAVISEGVYSRYVHGAMGDGDDFDLATFKEGTDSLAARAREAIEQWG